MSSAKEGGKEVVYKGYFALFFYVFAQKNSWTVSQERRKTCFIFLEYIDKSPQKDT